MKALQIAQFFHGNSLNTVSACKHCNSTYSAPHAWYTGLNEVSIQEGKGSVWGSALYVGHSKRDST